MKCEHGIEKGTPCVYCQVDEDDLEQCAEIGRNLITFMVLIQHDRINKWTLDKWKYIVHASVTGEVMELGNFLKPRRRLS